MNSLQPFPPAKVEYAEQLLSSGLQQEVYTASFYGNGALTAISVLLAVYALLLSIAIMRPGLPAPAFLYPSVALILLAGVLLGIAWYICDMGEQTKPLEATEDLLVKGLGLDEVHERVVLGMKRTYEIGRVDLTRARRLLAVALPLAAVGLSIFVYGVAHV